MLTWLPFLASPRALNNTRNTPNFTQSRNRLPENTPEQNNHPHYNMPKSKGTPSLKRSAAPKKSKQADAAILANAKKQGESLVHVR